MKTRLDRFSLPLLSTLLLLLATGPASAQPEEPGPHMEGFPGEAAYRRELTAAETAYVERVMEARGAYVAAIRDLQMRASMLPAQSQAMDAEVERIESLPPPRVIPEPVGEAGKGRKVSLSLDAPNGLWSLEFVEARRVGDEVWVLWALRQQEGMGTMAITTVEDAAVVDAGDLPADAPVQHLVTGKTWNWENETGPNVRFVDGDAGEAWSKGRRLDTVE